MECCPKCGGKPKSRQILCSLEPDDPDCCVTYRVTGYVCSKCGRPWRRGEAVWREA